MNLLPADSRRFRQRAGFPRRVRMVGSVVLAGFTLTAIGLDIRSLTTRLESARTERDRLRILAAERRGLEERLVRDRDRLRRLRVEEARLARWDEERFLLPELLRALSAAIPDAVVLEAVRRDGSELRVTGRAGSAAVVARTLKALVATERMSGLELLWLEQAREGADSAEQRFALAGPLRYASSEPARFERVGAQSRIGEGSR